MRIVEVAERYVNLSRIDSVISFFVCLSIWLWEPNEDSVILDLDGVGEDILASGTA